MKPFNKAPVPSRTRLIARRATVANPVFHETSTGLDWASVYSLAKHVLRVRDYKQPSARLENEEILAAALVRMLERQGYCQLELEALLGPPARVMRGADIGVVYSPLTGMYYVRG